MAINGSLDEASLADVLQLLSLGRKTGRLSVSDLSNLGHIYLEEGKITHAFLVNRQQRLGDILFKNGCITQDQLNEAMLVQEKHPDKKVGELLVAIGATTEAALEHYMQVQIEEAVYFLFTWRRGDFAFERDVKPDPRDFLVSINPEALLLEGARRVDEWSVIEKKIPSFNMVFAVDAERIETSKVELSEEQRRIAALLDGVRDVAAIVADTGLIEFEVGKALYGLITAGFAEPVGPRLIQDLDDPTYDISARHLDRKKLLEYLTHQAEFADPKRRRQSGLHIADCPTCSKNLQEVHIRRSQGLSAVQEELSPEVSESSREPAERRGRVERRKSDAADRTDQAKDRRTHGAGDRRSDRRIAAVQGPPPDKERRRPGDRRTAERRSRERRVGTPVDRSDRAAVERRRGLERRLRERRVVPRRMADVKFQVRGGKRQTVPLAISAIAGTTATQGPKSGRVGKDGRDTVSVRSVATRGPTSVAGSNHSSASSASLGQKNTKKTNGTANHRETQETNVVQPASAPAEQTNRQTRPSVRRMRESPLRGLPLLADGTQWMFVDRSESEADTELAESKSPGSAVATPAAAPAVPNEEIADSESKASAFARRTTGADMSASNAGARTTEFDIVAPRIDARARKPVAEAARQGSAKRSSRTKSPDMAAEDARRELEQAKAEVAKAKSEAAKAKADAEKTLSEAEKTLSEAAKAKSDAEAAKLEARKAQSEAARAKSEAEVATKTAEKAALNAEKATTKAQNIKSEAAKRKSEAVQTRSEAKKAKEEIERARADADKAKREAERARSDAERARQEADEATAIADSVRSEAERVKYEAEKAKLEAENARAQAEAAKREAEKAKSDAEMVALKAQELRAGRGTPVSLKQLVGGYSPQRISAPLRSAPAAARQGSEQAPANRQARRKPVVWVGLAAIAVLATATGWLARPFLSAGSETPLVSADNAPPVTAEATPVPAERAPATTADSPLQDSGPVEPADAPPQERVVPAPATRPVETRPTRPAERTAEPTTARSQPTPAPAQPALEAAAAVPQPAPAPAATPAEPPPERVEIVSAVITINGAVREAGTLAPLAGVAISISGSDLSATTDVSGAYSLKGLPEGSLTVTAKLAGYMDGHVVHEAAAGESIDLDLVLRRPPRALQRDDELDGGEWATTDAADAAEVLGHPVAVVSNLWIESIARPATGSRPKVRVAHLTDAGERITLIVSRSGPVNRAAQPRVTALRIIPPTEAYPITTGTASFGGLLVTAKATLPAEELRAYLQRLVAAQGG